MNLELALKLSSLSSLAACRKRCRVVNNAWSAPTVSSDRCLNCLGPFCLLPLLPILLHIMSEKYEAEVPIMARSSTDSDEMQTQALLLEQNHQAQRKINRTRRIILISLLCAIPIIGISAFMHQGGSDYISKVATSSSAKWWSSQMDTTAEGLLPKCTRTFKYYFCKSNLLPLRHMLTIICRKLATKGLIQSLASSLEQRCTQKRMAVSFSTNFGDSQLIRGRADELLLESQPDWVYGKYSDYFEQPVPSCILDPSDDFRRRRAGDEGWNDPKHHPHIAMTRGQ